MRKTNNKGTYFLGGMGYNSAGKEPIEYSIVLPNTYTYVYPGESRTYIPDLDGPNTKLDEERIFEMGDWSFTFSLVDANKFKPTRVIFNGTTTVCYFGEEKVVVELLPGDTYDREKGLALCVAKYALGGYSAFRKLLENAEYYNQPKEEEQEEEQEQEEQEEEQEEQAEIEDLPF